MDQHVSSIFSQNIKQKSSYLDYLSIIRITYLFENTENINKTKSHHAILKKNSKKNIKAKF